MKKSILFPLLISGMLLSSCNAGMIEAPSGDVPHVESMSLSSDQVSLDVGKTETLTAYLSGNADVTWVLGQGANNFFDIKTNGRSVDITGRSVGTAMISAIAGDANASCVVTVNPQGGTTIVVNSITLNPTSSSLYVGESFTLTANVDATGGKPTVSFLTGTSGIISVNKQNDSTAIVSGLSVGTDSVFVTAGDKLAKCEVTVEEEDKTFSIKLNKTSLTLAEGESDTLVAKAYPEGIEVKWDSDNKNIATVDGNGKVTAVKEGSANISATITKDEETRVASCALTVTGKGGDDDYDKKVAAWSKPGHLYLHYLRNSDNNYDKWALWIWQNRPNDLEGSLWGAGNGYNLKGITPQTYGHMTKEQCGGTTGDSAVYVDSHGIVIDVDLTVADLKGGKSGEPSPLVTSWDGWSAESKNALGFLIVDQTKMDGSDNWTSDGGAETYIKRLGKLLPDGKNGYLHVYCVEGNVANFTTTSGKQEFDNPTATDTTGKYRSKNDITNLKADKWTNGVGTSSSFLEDTPGVGYQIFVPSFCDSDGDGFGDLRGITSKLDYLQDLGVEVLWLTPIQESNSYHGYDVTDYYKIDPKFGSLEDYQELLFKAHEKGMKVLMDMVINHTSKSNVLFKKSQVAATEVINGKTINYRDMYQWKFKGDKVLEWDGREGTYSATNPATYKSVNVEDNQDWYVDGTSNYYYYGKFGSGMAELNYSCQSTRDYMTDMCKYWLSFGLDGFRLDAIKHIYLLSELDPTYNYSGDYITYDVSYKTAWNEEKQAKETTKNDYTYDRDLNVIFWKQFAGEIKSAYPNCFLVGENYDGWNERIAPFYQAIDSQFDFSTYYHMNENVNQGIAYKDPQNIADNNGIGYDIQRSLGIYYKERSNGINGAFTSNHDVGRFVNHCVSSTKGEHQAEINSSNASGALNKARWSGALTVLTPGVSWIYYGDEIGLSGNVKDVVPDSHGRVYDDHGNNTDRWYRQPMRWGATKGKDGVVNYTFGGIEVVWDKYNSALPTVPTQVSDPNSLYTLFKNACKAKNDDRYPTYGRVNSVWAENNNVNLLGMHIKDSNNRSVYVFVNATNTDQNISAGNQGTYLWGSAGASGTGTKVPKYGFTVVIK